MRVIESSSRSVIGAFLEVYNTLGYGFLEHFYVLALEHELRERGHHVARELSVDVRYKHLCLGQQRMDMVVDHRIVVEAKATEVLHPSAKRQLFNYLKATKMDVGLLLHFGREPKFHRVEYPHALGPRG
jgi:GxxExxY protein